MMLIAEMRSWRSQAFCTGVCPDGAQVRRRTGWSMKRFHPREPGALAFRSPFLSAANPASAPLDGVVVRLPRLMLGLLAGPAEIAENLPDVTRMVGNLKPIGDYRRDT